jgi:glycogen synthase
MRVLHISNDFLPLSGGISTHLQNLLKQQSSMGMNVRLIVPDETIIQYSEEQHDGYQVQRVPYKGTKNQLLKLKRITDCVQKRLTEAHQEERIDIIHQHDHRATRTASSIFSKKKKIPLIWTNHYIRFFNPGEFIERIFPIAAGKSPDGIICVHKTNAQGNKSLGLKSITTEYIPNGVDCDLFKPHESPKSLAAGISVLFPQRMDLIKGPDVLASAILKLKKKCFDKSWRFYFAGSNPASNIQEKTVLAIKKKLQVLESEQIVFFLDTPLYCEMPQLYRSSDIVVLPLQEETENIAVLEAWASGKALISTRKLEKNGYAKHAENCWLTDTRDSDQLARAIEKLAENPSLRKQLGMKGRELAENLFTWKKIATKTLGFYDKITQSLK